MNNVIFWINKFKQVSKIAEASFTESYLNKGEDIERCKYILAVANMAENWVLGLNYIGILCYSSSEIFSTYNLLVNLYNQEKYEYNPSMLLLEKEEVLSIKEDYFVDLLNRLNLEISSDEMDIIKLQEIFYEIKRMNK